MGCRAFVSIMEGCSKYCSFCIVPYTRGEEVSRGFDSVLTEVRQLAEQGVVEVTLLGQNVNAYRGPMADGELADLATLIHHVARVPGIERIRFTTSHPLEFDDSLIEAYANVPKLASHLHLPVQCGSDRMLALMKRGYTSLEFKDKRAPPARGAPGHLDLHGFHRRLSRGDRARLRGHAARWRAMPTSTSRSAFSTAAVPAPRPPRCRMRSTPQVKQARLTRLQAQLEDAGAADQPRHGGQPPARADRVARAGAMRASSPGAPPTTASSTSPAPRP